MRLGLWGLYGKPCCLKSCKVANVLQDEEEFAENKSEMLQNALEACQKAADIVDARRCFL